MPVTTTPGLVSVVLVNFRGADDTIAAIGHLAQLDWPQDRLEVVVVDNASGDDSVERIRAAAPQVTLVESSENLGFAGGCNLGVRAARGDLLAFLNNDARPDRDWIRAAARRFEKSPRVGAVASRVLDWDGHTVDFIGSALTWFGMGYKPLTGEPEPSAAHEPSDVLFGTGSAMFVRRSVFEKLAGFDERYFMFFEDVDFGWRLNLAGWRFVYEPDSLAFHKHHASMSAFGSFKETYLLERNALFTMYKNLGDEELNRLLAATMALGIRRAVARGELDSTEYDLRRGGPDSPTAEAPKSTLATVYGIDQFVQALPELEVARAEIQSSRVVSDARLWPLFGITDAPSFGGEQYLEGYVNIAEAFGIYDEPRPSRVLIITGDPIGAKMAGPAIRAWNMADALSQDHLVTLVSLARVEAVEAPFEVVHVSPGDERKMSRFEAESDIIIFQGLAMALFDTIARSQKIMICDIYDPMHLEQLEQGRELARAEWERQVGDATEILNQQLRRGDFFLCASERQRQFYLGQLAALGRINPANYENDPDLDRFLTVVPFGLNEVFPAQDSAVLKGVVPGIEDSSKVLLWSGGLYNWFDPATLIRAVAAVASRHDDVKLFFQGTKHPHPGVPEMKVVGDSKRLAEKLGVLDSAVFFNESWVDYANRHNYLGEADAGVSTHFAHVETTFSFRTRILDYLWAELPMVVTEGDHFAELVEREGLGIVVPSADVAALEAAIERVLYDDGFRREARANIARVRAAYEWSNVLEPLVAFAKHPAHAPDLVERGVVPALSSRPARAQRPRRRMGVRHDASLALHYLREGGVKVVVSKARGRLRRAFRRAA
jgi:GT2 family glycosyltransferase/glycosyltransferase involved in cell wall biosynthesis